MSDDDGNVVLDENDDDWEWRRRIRANPATRTAYRVVVFIVGLVVVVGGLALVPLPGPGWVIVFVGLAIWASEFETAQTVLRWVKARVKAWTDWVGEQSLVVRLLVGLLVALLVVAVFWALFKVSGVPTLLPDQVEEWLHTHARL